MLNWIDWGDAPSWFEALGTVGAFAFGFIAWTRDRRMRYIDELSVQARAFNLWINWNDRDDIFWRYLNPSGGVIANVVVVLHPTYGNREPLDPRKEPLSSSDLASNRTISKLTEIAEDEHRLSFHRQLESNQLLFDLLEPGVEAASAVPSVEANQSSPSEIAYIDFNDALGRRWRRSPKGLALFAKNGRLDWID